jgi:hypothetical protein
MNSSPFWPLVWKEYRTGRAFWLAMAAMGLVAQGGVAWLAHLPADRNWWLYGIALMISAGFAVGIGGTLFAVEHEDRTFGLMRILPLGAKELGAAKILCALAGLAGLLAILWLAAGALAGWQSLSSRDAGQLWGLWGLACAEGLAWGVLCSLVFSSPLRATVIALLAVTLSIQAAVTLTSRHNLADIASYSEAIPFRLVLLLVVAALDAWLLPRWLAGRVPHTITRRSKSKSAQRAKADAAWSSPAPSWSVQLGHLMWHTWREVVGSVWLLALGAAVSLPVTVLVLTIAWFLQLGQQWIEPPTVNGLRMFPLVGLLPFVVVTGLAGSLVFRNDPTSGARFLAERGVSARLLWAARQLVWGGWLFALLLAAGCLAIVPGVMEPPVMVDAVQAHLIEHQFDSWVDIAGDSRIQHAIFRLTNSDIALNAFLAWAVLFSAFAAAQLVSLIMRRRLLAAVFSIVLGTLAAGWTYLMIALDIPWWWSVLPLACGCLLATWLRTPGWMLARPGWRGWILPAAAVVAPVALLAIAVPRYRTDEIPAVKLDWPAEANGPAAESSPAAIADVKAALASYQRAYDAYLVQGKESSDADEQTTAELTLEASRYRSTWLPDDPHASQRVAMPIYHLGIWLSTWADKCQGRGQLDKALDAYLAALRVADHFEECAELWRSGNQDTIRSWALQGLRSWAAVPGQTPEQLREAIRGLDASRAAAVSGAARLRSWYFAATAAIADYPLGVADDGDPQSLMTPCVLTSRLPWERERALRLEKFITKAELDTIRMIGRRFLIPEGVGGLLTPLFYRAPWDWGQLYTTDEDLTPAIQWLRTTPLVTEQGLWRESAAWSLVADETDLRATTIILALEAWKAEHGRLPDKLEQLVPTELAAVPLDPVWAEPFLYYPQGVAQAPDDRLLLSSSVVPEAEEELKQQHRPRRVIDWEAIGQQPFLWSALSPVSGVQPVIVKHWRYGDQTVATYYELEPPRQSWWYPPVPQDSVLQAGQAYVVRDAEAKQP